MILDIHTHNPSPDPSAVIDLSQLVRERLAVFSFPDEYSEKQRFSVGIHPWSLTEDVPEELLEAVETVAALPQTLLVGEAGIDIPKGGPLFRQMLVFKRMVEISEKVGKPLLIHNVKAQDIIIGIHKEIRPTQPWIIHGFRSKPTVADMMLREGFYLSFGPSFNPVTVHNVPSDRILAETDNSDLAIREVLHCISDARGTDVTHLVEENARKLFSQDFSS